MKNSLHLQTNRLFIRPITINDSNVVFQYRSDKITNKFQGWIPDTVEETCNFIKDKIATEINIPDTWFQFVIIEKETNRLIGDIGIHFLNIDNYQVEIGCTIDKLYQSKGFASEALKIVIDYLFNNLDKRRIVASIDPANYNSIKLVERLGFRKEAHFKESILINNIWVDDLVYAILKKEWENQIGSLFS